MGGLLVTLFVGYLTSFILRKITGTPASKENYDPNLFVPPLAKILRRRKNPEISLKKLPSKSDQAQVWYWNEFLVGKTIFFCEQNSFYGWIAFKLT